MRTLKFTCSQLPFLLPSIIITITSNEPGNTETHKTDRNPPITNHKPWPFEPVKVKFCFLRGPLRWLTAAKNTIVSWLLNFRIRMFMKSAVKSILNIYEYRSVWNIFFTEISLPIHTILIRIQSNASMWNQNAKQHSYSWTSLQQPPWERKKVAIVKDGCYREFLNKGQCTDFLSARKKKVAVVERWPL